MDNQNELYHHGILGMKWGIRRYQNKDGSLTPAGRKRANKLKDEYLQVTGKKLTGYALKTKSKSSSQNKDTDKKKSINEMTTDELREKTNRMRAEKEYIEAQNNLRSLNPEKVSKGKSFVKFVAGEMIRPAAINVGKQAFSSLFAYGMNELTGADKKKNVNYAIHPNNKKKD